MNNTSMDSFLEYIPAKGYIVHVMLYQIYCFAYSALFRPQTVSQQVSVRLDFI